jgi:hypothetical protein
MTDDLPPVTPSDVLVCRALDMATGATGAAAVISAVSDRPTWLVVFGLLAAIALVARAALVRELEK